jgi:RNA polymerase sigma-70 factor (ECF subfamily)
MSAEARNRQLAQWSQHAEWLQRLALRLVRDASAAEDLVQDTWLSAQLSRRKPEGSWRAWLATILRNHARQRAREARARSERERSRARDERVESAADTVARAQAMQRLVEAVLALDEPYRATLISHFQDGLSAEAIAQRDHTPASTVRSRIARGLAELRRRLEQRDGAQWTLALAPVLAFERASSLSPLGAALLGAFTMKKLVAASILVAALGWLALRDGDSAQPAAHDLSGESRTQTTPADEARALEDPTRAAVEGASRADSAPLAARAQTASLTVSVTWAEGGAPAEGIGVDLLEWASSLPFASRRQATTDAQGRAHFDGVLPGSLNVSLDRADGVTLELASGEQRVLELAIPPGIRVLGRVVDERGAGIANADIWLSDYANSSSGTFVARSDSSGAFAIEHVGESRSVAAFADGFAPSTQRDVVAGPRKTFEVTLELDRRGGALAGRVLDPQGQPIAGAQVLIDSEGTSSLSDAEGRTVSSAPPQRVQTDRDGRFALANLAARRVPVAVRHSEFAPWRGEAAVLAGQTAELEIELERGAVLEGVVRNSAGEPAPGVQIGVGEYGGFTSSTTRSDERGEFRIEGLAAGGVEVRASARERGAAKAIVATRAGESVRWDPVLEVAAGLSGVVVDEHGAPRAGWKVGATERSHPGLFLRHTTTDAEGRFALENWPAKAEAIEVREAGRWSGPAAATIPARPADGPVRIVVSSRELATARVVASVAGRDGRPLAELRASLWPEGANQGMFAEYDADRGRISAGPVKAGRYRLEVQAPTLGTRSLEGLELETDSTLDAGEVRFEEPGRIRVRLSGLSEDDARAPNVSLAHGAGPFFGGLEIANGEARSAPLQPGVYRVGILDTRYVRRVVEVTLEPGAEAVVELALEPGTYRIVELTTEGSSPLPLHVDWELRDERGAPVEASRAAPFEAKLRVFLMGLTPGRYSLELVANDGRRGAATFEVADLAHPSAPISVELR